MATTGRVQSFYIPHLPNKDSWGVRSKPAYKSTPPSNQEVLRLKTNFIVVLINKNQNYLLFMEQLFFLFVCLFVCANPLVIFVIFFLLIEYPFAFIRLFFKRNSLKHLKIGLFYLILFFNFRLYPQQIKH